jgi:hypothetical protein
MKRISRIISTLALLLLTLSAVTTADAALTSFSPTPARFNGVSLGGMPAWYQDQNGVSVQPCIDPLGTCGLIGLGDPFFNEALPLAFPGNFPSEAFYFDSVTNDLTVAGHVIFVIYALEFTFVDPVTGIPPAAPPMPAGALGVPFMRLRFVIAPPAGRSITLGNWTIDHPWGRATFDTNTCRNPAARCRLTRDLPVPGAIPPNFAAALGTGVADSISTFLQDPLAPTGFLGTAAAALSVTGGALGNSFTVTDPDGNTGSTASFQLLTGKKIGMELKPGNHINHGGTLIVPPAGLVPVPQTVTVTNTAANPILFPALATAGGDLADFIITSPPAAGGVGCSGATVPALGTCSFDVTFTPAAIPKAARAATILLAPTAVQPVPAPAIPIDNPPPVTLNLSGTAQVTVTALGKGHGSITPDTLVADAGTNVTFTVAPANPKFKVNEVTDGATLLGTPAAIATLPNNPPFTLPVGAANHAVTATFMPSGDVDANGTLDVADAVKALNILTGLKKPDADDPDNTAVKVAPLVAGKPAPDATRVEPNVGDVLVILRRVVGLETW